MRTVGIRLMADVSAYTRNMQQAGRTTREFAGGLEKADKAGKLDHVTQAATGLGLGLVGVAGVVTKFTMDFDKQMSAVQAATHASAGSMSSLRDAAMKAGADTQYSATEAAKGIEELAKAGVSTSNILGGGLTGALSLAAAGQLDVGEAAETAATAMTMFGLSGSQVPHVADLLSAAAGKAQGSVQDMGMALKQGGLVASQMGVSIEETTGTLAAFASAGLLGSDAGTSFKTSLLMLANPTSKSADLMEELGIQAYDAQGNFVGMANLAGQLQSQLGGLTQEQRNSALATIFGSDAIRAANVLYKEGATGIKAWTDKTNDAGYAAETAAMKTDNLAGDIERLTGSLETLAIQSGSGANSGLRVLAKSANGLVDQFSKLSPLVGGSITVMAALTGGALLLGVGWLKARTATAEMMGELRKVGPAGERAATGIEKTRKAATRAAVAFVALQAASAAISSMQDELNPQIDALAAGLTRYGNSADLSGEASRVLGSNLSDLQGQFQILADGDNARRATVKSMQGVFEDLVPGLDGTNTSLTRTRERVTALDSALAQMVQNGQAGQAKAAFDRLAAALAVNGVSMEEFRKQFPAYAGAVETAAASSNTAAGAVKGVGTEARNAESKVKDLTEAFDKLFDQYMSSDQAALKYQTTLAATNKELKSGTKSLSLNTEEGRTNRGAVLDLLDAIKGQRDANIKNGQTLDSANGKYKTQVSRLKDTMLHMGYTRTDINKLIGKYEDIPNNVKTKVSATGIPGVERQLTRLSVYQNALKKGLPVGFNGPIKGPDGRYYAEGGYTGPGDKYQPAGVVHADEFVIKKSSRQQIETRHPGLLDEMNATGQVPPGYAGGGVVWPYPVTASRTRIPSRSEVAAAVVPAGGQTWQWIIQAARALVPGIGVISTVRPGAHTLSGNLSYHAMGRAVDFSPSMQLARKWNQVYGGRTKEEITPWRQYDLWHGAPHRYSAALHAQHSGGNAHVHIAMANGGVIREPVVGVGASGTTYSFGENGPERVIPAGTAGGGGSNVSTVVHLNVALAAGANPREAGRQIADSLTSYLSGGGSVIVRGSRVL